jgi:DNA-binding NtrC family response regulator
MIVNHGLQALIFVVDDEFVIASTVALILRSRGFDARDFTEPLAALEASRSESPDLLFSDVVMPELDGFELGAQISKVCPQCKVLLFSGNPGVYGLQNRREFEVLEKPMQPAQMVDAVWRLLGNAAKAV